jgi:hypothetical protein
MSRNARIGRGLLYAVSAIALAYGFFYVFTPDLLPYHRRYLGMPERPLDPAAQRLMLLIYRGVGVAMIATGVTLGLMVRWLLARGDARGWWLIAVMMTISLTPMVAITRAVGPYTPWWGILGLLAIVFAALGLTRSSTRG